MIPLTKIRVETVNGKLCLTRASGGAEVSARAVLQLCKLAGVPMNYAKRIPATLLVNNLNHGLAHRPNAHKETVNLRVRDGVLEEVSL
jgi:hypothetical protein